MWVCPASASTSPAWNLWRIERAFCVEVTWEATMKAIATRVRAVLAVIGIGLALSACGYNTIPTLQEQAKARWSDVQNQYQRRADLIPNLVATVQGYAAQEKSVLTAVVEARAKATQVKVSVDDLTDPAKLRHSRMRRTSSVARSGDSWR